MDGDISAAADIVTGAVVASAVEPNAASRDASPQAECLNCGAMLIGVHCHVCGQKAKTHRTLSAFGHDILHSVFHFDGKIWRTLPMLAWNPGHLTRRYIHGERAKFVSPLALFLFTVFLTFAVFNTVIPSAESITEPLTREQAAKRLETDRKDMIADIEKLKAEKQDAIADKEPTGWIDGEIERNREALGEMEAETRVAAVSARRFALLKRRNESAIARQEALLAAAKAAGKPTAAIVEELENERLALKLLTTAANATDDKVGIKADWNFTDVDFPGAAALNDAAKHAAENPQLLIYKVQSNAYKFSWALIPISVPFVWLLFFWKRQFKVFDHAVFVTYSLTFMMVALSLAATLIAYGTLEAIGGLIIAFVPPIHMYRQLKQAYGLSRFGALWRLTALMTFALFALILFATLILALGVTG
jgi:hypothetical protein